MNLHFCYIGNPGVIVTCNDESRRSTSSAEVPGSRSIIAFAESRGIAMHAVARASASMADGATTVALTVVVIAGRPVTGLMVCHALPEPVSR